jgi:hypothetical protein
MTHIGTSIGTRVGTRVGTRFGLLAAITAVLVGCTTTRTLLRPRSADQLQSMIRHHAADVTLLYADPAGPTPPLPSLAAVPVSAPAGESPAIVPLGYASDLRGYEVRRRGLGSIEGLAIGALIGFVAGTVIGLIVMTDSPPCDDPHLCFRLSAGAKAFLVGGLGAAGGLLIGRHVGEQIGHTDRYLFVDPQGPRL